MKLTKVFLLSALCLVLFSASVFGANVALSGTATQSSDYYFTTVAPNANDGSLNGSWPNTALTSASTKWEWWHIDLGDQYRIDSIKIFARTDCTACLPRLRNVYVMVSDTPFSQYQTPGGLNTALAHATWTGQFPSDFNSLTQTFSSIATLGRYVLIQKSGNNNTNYLTLAEVQIEGVPAVPPVADAGADQTVAKDYPVTLNGTGTDADGTIVSYLWTEGATTLSAVASFSKNDFSVGTHTLTLTVTDDDGLTSTDTVVITIVPPITCLATPGLEGTYYNNRTFTPPSALIRTDDNIDFSWGLGSPDSNVSSNNFSTQWSGKILVPETADYIFSLAHDDVMTLIIDGDTIYDRTDWTGGSENFRDASPVSLSAGTHTITIKMIEWYGGAYVRLAWRNSASISSQTIIPPENYCSGDAPLRATDDTYSTSPGLTLTGVNFITDDTGNGADSGGLPPYTANTTPTTAPTQGTVTIQNDGSFTYVPNLNASGQDFFDYTITDYAHNTATATVTILFPSAPPATMNTFQRRYITNLKGNIRIIGNSVLQGANANNINDTRANNRLPLWYIDTDNTSNTFNSSSADINATESGVDITQAKIVWAGLYWQGYLHNDQSDTGIDSQYNFSTNINTANTQIINTIQNQTILLKAGNGSYASIAPNAIGTDRQYFVASRNYVSFKYAAFADVTSILQNQPPNATYTVANIPTRTGQTNTSIYDGLGTYGAWSLAIIYDNTPSPVEKTRNISVYDGYVVLSAANNSKQTIDVAGFKTPKKAPHGVDSTLSIFAGEGDRYILGDYAKIINQDGSEYNLPDTTGAGSYFASVVEGVPLRNPVLINNNGIDIHTNQVGTASGGLGAIQVNHTSASIELGTTQDTFMPSLITFATELYVPKICYDYTIQQDGFDITDSSDDNRSFRAIGGGQIDINLAIKSEEGDFDFVNSKLNLMLSPLDTIDFSEAFYAPNNVNTYVPAILSTDHTYAKPSIAIGELPSSSGGTIKAMQKYFSKFRSVLNNTSYNGKFDFELNTTIDFGSGPVPLLISSANGNIDRCAQSSKYDPLYGSFNVERHNSGGAPEEKYPLYTQVVGRDFDFDVVAYKKDPAPAYSSQMTLDGYTVDIELINIRPYNDKNATFSCYNPDPSIIQVLTSNGKKHIFASFNNTSRVNMSSLNVQTYTALRNAAFRVWYLVDQNNSIIPYSSTDPSDNTYFQDIYNTYLKAGDVTLQAGGTHGFCTVETLGAGGCSSYSNPESDTDGCYACMRDFFSKPVCSRDNFAIRPASYRLRLSDTNESRMPTQTVELGINNQQNEEILARLAAGYKYRLDGNATSFADDHTAAEGYTREFDNSHTEELSSLLRFDDKNSCYDTNTTKWGIYFRDGKVSNTYAGSSVDFDSGNLLAHSNAGQYIYNISDSDWTLVDQARYTDKTFPGIDDCAPNTAHIPDDESEKVGCDINSTLTFTDASGTQVVYSDLRLDYQPYSFSLADINFSISPDGRYLFMTNLDNSYYQDAGNLDLTMSAIHEGNITAMSKDGKVTTNFTDSCAAEPLSLHITRLTEPTEASLSIPMQQVLVYGSDPLKTHYDDNITGVDANLTLATAGFEDQAPYGSAHIRIYSTFKKPNKKKLDDDGLGEGINPIKIHYRDLRARSEDANGSAHLSIHIPKGIIAKDQNVTFLYGRVLPRKILYRVTEDEMNTTVMVAVYCDGDDGLCSDNDLNTTATAENLSENWYLATRLSGDPQQMFGETTLDINYFGGKVTPIILHDLDEGEPTDTEENPPMLQEEHFDETALKWNLNVKMKYPLVSNRPTKVRIGIYPPVWLWYDPNPADRPAGAKTPAELGTMENYYDVYFPPKPTSWTGYGKTGHIVGDIDHGDDISPTKTKRLEF